MSADPTPPEGATRIETPAPELVQPEPRERTAPSRDSLADIAQRLRVVEDQLGIKPRGRHEPIPGSTVVPLDENG